MNSTILLSETTILQQIHLEYEIIKFKYLL